MSRYLFIESRDPFESSDVVQQWHIARELAGQGNDVAMFLVQNGVLAARKGARIDTLDPSARISIHVDDLSLAERGIDNGSLRDNVEVAGIDSLTDLIMEDGRKVIWT